MPEIDLLNKGVPFETGQTTNAKGQDVSQLIVLERPVGWQHGVAVIMNLHDADDIKGALKTKDKQPPRGDTSALRHTLEGKQHE